MYLIKIGSAYIASTGQSTDKQSQALRVPDAVRRLFPGVMQLSTGYRFVKLVMRASDNMAPDAPRD